MGFLTLDQPLHDLDVNLHGGVRAWAATDLPTARTIFEDHPHLSKNMLSIEATGAQRQDAAIALRELFTRFPGLRLAVPEAELTTLISPAINGLTALPVTVD